jgi:hypothetical protein
MKRFALILVILGGTLASAASWGDCGGCDGKSQKAQTEQQ